MAYREQLAKLFDRNIKAIGKHINNVLKEELDREVGVAKFKTTTKHGAIAGKKQIIDNNILTAITLLIAESNPIEKDIIIDLILNFLDN